MTSLAIAPCSGVKLPHAAPARELYAGSLYQLAARTATVVGDDWAILSALHGIVHPDTVLEPYDQQLGGEGAIRPRAVADQLAADWPDVDEVIALTPNAYTALLAGACSLAGIRLTAPLAHSAGIGEQRGRLAAMLRAPSRASWARPAV